MTSKFWRIALAGLVLSVVVACGDDDGGEAAPVDDGSTSDAGATGDPVRLGALLELSGPASAFGQSALQALELAVDRLNEAGGVEIDGVSHEFELVVVDNETDPSAAIAGAQQLINDDGVQFIIGPVVGSLGPPVAQVVEPHDILMISDAATLEPLIEGDALETTGRLLFRSLYPNKTQAEIAAEGIIEFFPDAQRVALVLPDDGSGRADSVVGVADALEERGVEVVAQEFVPGTATDFQTVLTGVRDRDPDLLFVCCTPPTIGGLMRQSTELGLDAAFMYYSGAPLSLALEDAIGEQVPFDVAVTYLPSVLERLPSGEVLTAKPGVEAFAAEVEAAGFEIDSATALGMGLFYDTIALLGAAMEEAGSVDDTAAIAAALEEVTVDGANGTVGFGPGHAWAPPADVCVVRAGNPVPECVQIEPPG